MTINQEPPLLRLPLELLHLIVDSCDSTADVAAWSLASRYFQNTVGHLLYENHIISHDWKPVFWAAEHGRLGTLQRWATTCKLLHHGTDVNVSLNIYTFKYAHTFLKFLPPVKQRRTYQTTPFEPSRYSRGDQCMSPIHLAAKHGHTDIVSFLLDHGTDIDAPSRQVSPSGLSVFRDARDHNSFRENPFPVAPTALHLAVIFGQAEVAELLLQRGADIVVPTYRQSPAQENEVLGVTALHLAAAFGMASVVRLLAAREDVDVNAPDMHGQPPLLYAAEAERGYPALEALRESGADLDCVVRLHDRSTASLLITLIRRVRWRAAERLILLGASIGDDENRKELLEACEIAKMSVIFPDVLDEEAWNDLVGRIRGAETGVIRNGTADQISGYSKPKKSRGAFGRMFKIFGR